MLTNAKIDKEFEFQFEKVKFLFWSKITNSNKTVLYSSQNILNFNHLIESLKSHGLKKKILSL